MSMKMEKRKLNVWMTRPYKVYMLIIRIFMLHSIQKRMAYIFDIPNANLDFSK